MSQRRPACREGEAPAGWPGLEALRKARKCGRVMRGFVSPLAVLLTIHPAQWIVRPRPFPCDPSIHPSSQKKSDCEEWKRRGSARLSPMTEVVAIRPDPGVQTTLHWCKLALRSYAGGFAASNSAMAATRASTPSAGKAL